MLSVDQAKEKLSALYQRRFAQWCAVGADEVTVDIPLHPPTESVALHHTEDVASWIRGWGSAEQTLTHNSHLKWESRRWASAGTNTVPIRLVLPAPSDVAQFIGKQRHWETVQERITQLNQMLQAHAVGHHTAAAEQIPDALRRSAKSIAELPESDFQRLQEVTDWLLQHQNSQLFPRQLPVRGVHTKWLEGHRKIIAPLVAAVTGDTALGLNRLPVTLRIRVLDPVLAPGGIQDITAPVSELSAWDIQPRCVVVVENLQSLLALPPISGAIGIHNPGSTGAPLLAELPWLHSTDLIYWGDIDVEGLRILSRVRSHLPHTRSILTDCETLQNHRDLAGDDHPQAPRSMPAHLTPSEEELFTALAQWGNLRLEQERVPWNTVLEALHQAAAPHG
ncbi:DUF2220 family protein [Nesterenkonia massiliensis]|uniref:DUF2220 family protein n=1 Tax=Nesterenkonia massiliensis TaxID=1232429 RepID=A0ABT2HTW4_9MICC|nr:DUF3322 and DUF2220 domain-containing protein [Nesterenkonia massiliensis]MCT1607940.1 DUF2220 family protein [Nesterenkonia massiliensis]